MRRSIRRVPLLTSVLLLFGIAAPALHAQGSSVYAQGACMTGTSGAGIASPCEDASAVFFNPAALTLVPSQATLGLTAIHTTGEFTYDPVWTGLTVEREPATVPVPHAFLNWRGGERWALGIGAFAPYGLGIEWPLHFEGRYVGYDNSMQGLYIQPTVSYEAVPGLMYVGAGVDIVRGKIEINQRLDAGDPTGPFAQLGLPLGIDYADVRLAGDGWGMTGHLALLVRASDRFQLGARYLHSAGISMSGDGRFQQVATGIELVGLDPANPDARVPLDAVIAQQLPPGQGVATEITFPAQAVFGVAFHPTRTLALLADYQWTGWSSFDEFPLEFEQMPDQTLILDYEDTHTLRLGATYSATPELDLRAGFIYNTAASPDETVTPLLPEAERNYYTLGLGYRVGDVQLDFGYQLVDQADRRGRVRGRASRDITAEQLNRGVYSGMSHVFGLTASYRFGDTR